MKDQYFGDFGDYQKLSLLHILRNQDLNIVVHWLKTRDDASTDGKHIVYLEAPSLWRDYDPEVYDYLKDRFSTGRRTLAHIENSHFCRDITFKNSYIEDLLDRESLMHSILSDPKCQLVFFDPDNGIEVASTNRKNVHKYVLWKEMTAAFDSGKSIMIYQHFSRSNRENFIREKLANLKEKLGADVLSLRGKHSVYLLAIQKDHSEKIRESLAIFYSKWKNLGTII